MNAPIGELMRLAGAGDPGAPDTLFVALYRELHDIAERELRRGGSELTLGTTTLLHEAYLNIARREGVEFGTRGQFLAYAARAMRGLTIDYARRNRALKRGGEFHLTGDGAERAPAPARTDDLEGLGAALETLVRFDPGLAELVDLHFFCGFSFAEVAQIRGISERTVYRDWRKARLLLHRFLQDLDPGGPLEEEAGN
ncbi:MAG TPA: ECF-type sigma factor [Gemmatimonadales bacterium]|nr:ECF-type sigma factor [Gemmatimonadales bacterium]